MSDYTHETVPTQFVEAEGTRYAYRRFGKAGTVPLLFLQYFNANMDGWDPVVTNSLAADHEVDRTHTSDRDLSILQARFSKQSTCPNPSLQRREGKCPILFSAAADYEFNHGNAREILGH